jgi:hypothetical protein
VAGRIEECAEPHLTFGAHSPILLSGSWGIADHYGTILLISQRVDRQVWLKPGDKLVTSIEKLGDLSFTLT